MDRIIQEATVTRLLQEAIETAGEVRQEEYGHPVDNFTIICKGWSAIFGVEVTVEQAVFAMIFLKMARHLTKYKRDNLVDIAGYIHVLDMIAEEVARRAEADRHSQGTRDTTQE
jgi:hypothetical protein